MNFERVEKYIIKAINTQTNNFSFRVDMTVDKKKYVKSFDTIEKAKDYRDKLLEEKQKIKDKKVKKVKIEPKIEKGIFLTYNKKYRVKIYKKSEIKGKQKQITKTFETLEEARKFRDNIQSQELPIYDYYKKVKTNIYSNDKNYEVRVYPFKPKRFLTIEEAEKYKNELIKTKKEQDKRLKQLPIENDNLSDEIVNAPNPFWTFIDGKSVKKSNLK